MSVQAMAWAFDQRGMEPGEKLVLLVLANRANGDGICYPGVRLIAEDADVSTRSVLRHLATLEERGLISRERRALFDGRGRTSNLYSLNLTNVPDWHVGRSTNVTDQDVQGDTGGTLHKEDRTVREPKGGALSSARTPRKARGTPIPEQFELSESDWEWASENCPTIDVRMSTRQFVTYWRGNGGLKVRWGQAWRNWCLKDEERAGNGRQATRTHL